MTRSKKHIPGQLDLFAPTAETLQGARSVTVVSSEPIAARVTLKTETVKNRYATRTKTYVLVNGERIGQFDDRGSDLRGSFPLTINGRRIKLSNEREYTIYERELVVITHWRTGKRMDGSKWWHPDKESVLPTSIALKQWKTLAWSEAAALRPGDKTTHEYPFQWLHGALTNGELSIPRTRPQGKQWKQVGIPPVPERYWEEFLSGLQGLFLQELLPFHRAVSTGQLRRRRAEEAREQRPPVIGGFWHGQGFERVALGTNTLYVRSDRKPPYVVDNAGVGALYRFDDYETARDLASGKITRKQARARGGRRIVHAGRWQDRVARELGIA